MNIKRCGAWRACDAAGAMRFLYSYMFFVDGLVRLVAGACWNCLNFWPPSFPAFSATLLNQSFEFGLYIEPGPRGFLEKSIHLS